MRDVVRHTVGVSDGSSGSQRSVLPTWLKASTTPDRLRVRALVTVALIIALGATAWLLTDRLVSQTNELAVSTGEVLVTTQQLSSSLAEADAAAVSVHLAGADGNREALRLFELSTERAASSIEQVARLVGDDDPSHTALSNAASRSTRYVGLIESARLASIEDIAGADSQLAEASRLNRSSILPEVQLVGQRARQRFDSQTQSAWYFVAIILLIVAVVLLLASQYILKRQFRRLINIPLVLASLLMIALVILSARAFAVQQSDVRAAENDAETIFVSQQIQENAYRHRALGTSSVLTSVEQAAELQAIEEELYRPAEVSGLLVGGPGRADSAREQAAAFAMITRWERYVEASDQIQDALTSGDAAGAQALTQGPANAAFNGFNTSVEAALLDRREDFLERLQHASDSLRWLRGMIFVGSLLAAVLTWWGFAQRIGEYR